MDIKKILLQTIVIYMGICLMTSAIIQVLDHTKKVQIINGFKVTTLGCDIDTPFTRMFYGKLFCQIEDKNKCY